MKEVSTPFKKGGFREKTPLVEGNKRHKGRIFKINSSENSPPNIVFPGPTYGEKLKKVEAFRENWKMRFIKDWETRD